MNKIVNLCVYCGSSSGKLAAYADAARSLAESMVKRDIGLVYGGAGIGIMGAVADHILQLGGRAIGVIPEALMTKEVAHNQLTEMHVTRSMHERKMLMADLADGFIALPGGIGTMEEIFEIWTWAQLGFHHKPCGLLNAEGYFDPLCAFLDHMVEEGFVKPHHRELLMVETHAEILLERFSDYHPPVIAKWIDKNEI